MIRTPIFCSPTTVDEEPKKPAAAVHAVVGFFMMYQMLIVIQFDGVVEFLGLVKVWEDVRRFDAPIIEHK